MFEVLKKLAAHIQHSRVDRKSAPTTNGISTTVDQWHDRMTAFVTLSRTWALFGIDVYSFEPCVQRLVQ